MSAKVRHGLVHLTLDVPDDDALLAWTTAPHKPLAGWVVFADTQGGPARETLAWEAGECVGYRETFESGSAEAGAYVCHLTIAATQLAMQPGGPAAYTSPAARDHGTPGVVLPGGAAEVVAAMRPQDENSRGVADRSAFHPLDPLPIVSANRLHGQTTGFTCVASCLRMILADKGFEYDETTLADALNTSSFGASIFHIPDALTNLQLAGKVRTSVLNGASLADLAAEVGQGKQAVVSVTIPGLGSHALVVEEISATHVHIRDPLPIDEGSTYKVKVADFEAYWNKRATLINA